MPGRAPPPARAARDTAVLGIYFAGIDVRETPSAALAFTRASASPTEHQRPDDLIGARFGAATPSTYVLGACGEIAWAWFGPTSYSQLETALVAVAGDSAQ